MIRVGNVSNHIDSGAQDLRGAKSFDNKYGQKKFNFKSEMCVDNDKISHQEAIVSQILSPMSLAPIQ